LGQRKNSGSYPKQYRSLSLSRFAKGKAGADGSQLEASKINDNDHYKINHYGPSSHLPQ
jgi:hypothetical protein